jgi:hypothetical protein
MIVPLPDNHPDRLELYKQRLATANAAVTRYASLDKRIGNARVVAFAAIILTCFLSYKAEWRYLWLPLLPLGVFVGLLVHHERIADALENARRLARFYQAGEKRLSDAWMDIGDTGGRYLDPAHPYAPDIDIFGAGSLYQLLSICRTRSGEDRLAEWLQAPAASAEIVARQEAVRELCERLTLREEIALLGQDTGAAVAPEGLARWGEADTARIPLADRLIAGCLATVNIACTVYSATHHNGYPLAIAVAITSLFNRPRAEWITKAIKTVGKASKPLSVLAELMARIEREPVESARLWEIHHALGVDGGEAASARIRRLEKLVAYLEATLNMAFMPVAYLLLWQFQFAAAIQNWRAANGPHLRRWMDATGDFEALGSLANFAFENPGATYPEIVTGKPEIVAEGLEHPLLPRDTRMGNDVTITSQKPLLIVSGSNMSGKSTLMRTLGTNIVLALAGAPVLARRMRLSPLNVGASIRTQDSIQGGVSRFYAEIKRIRQVVDLAGGNVPLLFLLDEILHGTNSHDRRIGAEAILRSLVSAGALGIVTTHDLALAKLADDPALGAVNVHFEDHIKDGKMVFDYQLRSGVVEKSNAIELMRAVGLDV